MRKLLLLLVVSIFILRLGSAAATPKNNALPGIPDGEGSYQDFVSLFQEFLLWKDPANGRGVQTLAVVAFDRTLSADSQSSPAKRRQ